MAVRLRRVHGESTLFELAAPAMTLDVQVCERPGEAACSVEARPRERQLGEAWWNSEIFEQDDTSRNIDTKQPRSDACTFEEAKRAELVREELPRRRLAATARRHRQEHFRDHTRRLRRARANAPDMRARARRDRSGADRLPEAGGADERRDLRRRIGHVGEPASIGGRCTLNASEIRASSVMLGAT